MDGGKRISSQRSQLQVSQLLQLLVATPGAAGSPRAYCICYSASGLLSGLHYSSSCSLLLGRTLGPASTFLCPPGGAQLTDLLALLRPAHLLLCRKTRSSTACANPSSEEPGPRRERNLLPILCQQGGFLRASQQRCTAGPSGSHPLFPH